jgi:hypothetical protein
MCSTSFSTTCAGDLAGAVDKKKNEISALKQALSDLFETYPFLRI